MKTRVVIVAKTRQGSRACIGAITADGRSVRLIAADAERDERAGMEYEVGETWDVDTHPAPQVTPPHTENIIVYRKQRLEAAGDPMAFIAKHMPPAVGGVDKLYDGLAQVNPSGSLYIAERHGVPSFSTLFWRPEHHLYLDSSGKRIRYRYGNAGGQALTFVGFQEPVTIIPAGSLLRVSLAHWWRPVDHPEEELRCYVQLSGWFGLDDSETPLSTASIVARTRPPAELADSLVAQARRTMKDVFGFDSFLPTQEAVVRSVLERRDTLAIMPTGGGKSLCFQLPALLFAGVTVVVSPLISLMQDQVDQLREQGIAAAFLNSSLDHREYTRITSEVRNGDYKLLYVSPETLLRPETLLLLTQAGVACLTVDEAHCISQWGHNFRPEYRELAAVRRRFPQAVCLAVTATATERVRDDIKRSLEIADANTFVASFDRPNLFLSAVPRADGFRQLEQFLSARTGVSGIIYSSTRQLVDDLAAALVERGWPALPYHAGLDDVTRARHQRAFSHDEVDIIVATIAFGMGIDKSNVRFVVHFNLPRDIESYYQEIGRAGRDGLPSECLLLYDLSDAATTRYFNRKLPEVEARAAEHRLGSLLRLAQATGCRRRPLLDYFAEAYPADNCGACDQCLTEVSRLQYHGLQQRAPGWTFPTHAGSRSQDKPATNWGGTPTYRLPTTSDDELFEQLHAKRKELADAAGLPPFAVFHDRSLQEMTVHLPRTRGAFLAIYGVNKSKAEKYADEFLPLIQRHREKHKSMD